LSIDSLASDVSRRTPVGGTSSYTFPPIPGVGNYCRSDPADGDSHAILMSVSKQSRSDEQSDEHAQATVNTTADGDILGVALFLGADDLSALGVTDADAVGYHVENGRLELHGVASE